MSGYCGAKFRPTGETYTATDRDGNSVVRERFVPTSGYMKWLEEQRKQKQEEELQLLKAKLQLQQEKYGEVDEVDFNEYRYKLKLYCGIVI